MLNGGVPVGVNQNTDKPFKLIVARAQVALVDTDEVFSPELATKVASWFPKITKGEPTKLKVSAWLCHEGRNNNGLVFRQEDLPESASKIASPNLIPMDWNHSAVVPWSDADPKAIGVWYAASVKWNPEAKGGKGALGIFAEGMVWAWAFPEKAAEMLGMQAERGYIEFSMACIPEDTESGMDADGYYEVAIRPVFFTLSALNMPPADPDAKGVARMMDEDDEDMMDDEEMLKDKKTKQCNDASTTSVVPSPKAAALLQIQSAFNAALRSQEENMEKKEPKEATAAALDAALEANTVLKSQLEEAVAVNEQLKAQVDALTAEVAAAKGATEEVAIARDALKTELESAAQQYSTLAAEYEVAKARLDEIEAENAKVAQASRWTARFEELPESYRAAFAKRSEEEQGRFVAKWSAASDEDWAEFKSDIMVAFSDVKLSYLALSRQEGPLPTGSAVDGDMGAKLAALKV